MTTAITKADVHRWLDAWNSHDIKRISDLFTEDVIMHQPQNPVPLTKEALLRYFGGLFGTYPDIHFETDGMVLEGLQAASWEIVTGTMLGVFKDPATGNDVQPTGKSFKIPGAMRLVYTEESLIKEVTIYWDRMLLMAQVGLLKQ